MVEDNKNNNFVIDTLDCRGKRVVFAFQKWIEKSATHPELRKKSFLENIRKTIENPEMIFQDKSDKNNRQCYYKKYSIESYVKVIVWTNSNPYCIVSAFETNYIKETKYPKLKQLL